MFKGGEHYWATASVETFKKVQYSTTNMNHEMSILFNRQAIVVPTINICEETCPKRIKTGSCQFKAQDWIVYDCMMAIWTWVKSHAKLSTAELNQAKSSWAKKSNGLKKEKQFPKVAKHLATQQY